MPWFPGETVISGIGQGYWVVTPVQLAKALSTLADGGIAAPPAPAAGHAQGVDGARSSPRRQAPSRASRSPHDAEDGQAVRQGMIDVVYGGKGTARGLGDGFPYVIAGKTGTAERYSRTTKAYQDRRDLKALATAIAPCSRPSRRPSIRAWRWWWWSTMAPGAAAWRHRSRAGYSTPGWPNNTGCASRRRVDKRPPCRGAADDRAS